MDPHVKQELVALHFCIKLDQLVKYTIPTLDEDDHVTART